MAGTILAVPAIGFTAIYAVLRFPNFAIAAHLTIGAFAGWLANVPLGLPVALAQGQARRRRQPDARLGEGHRRRPRRAPHQLRGHGPRRRGRRAGRARHEHRSAHGISRDPLGVRRRRRRRPRLDSGRGRRRAHHRRRRGIVAPRARARLSHRGGLRRDPRGPDAAPARHSRRARVLMENYLVAMAVFAGLYALLALGLNVVWGMTGMINLGLVGFFGLGAYASALLTRAHRAPIVLGLAAAALVTAAAGAAL